MNDNETEQQIYQEYDKPTKMNWREYLQLVKSLSKDLFKSNHVEVVDDALYMRALIAHMVVMLSRLAYPLIGIAYWQTAYDDIEQREDVDHKFVEISQHIVRRTVIVLIVLGVVLDIVVLKARKYAFIILYYEMIQVITHASLPYNRGDTGRAL